MTPSVDELIETIDHESGAGAQFPIVCFSHLGWDEKLFQRPQQIMTRLAAAGHKVYYFACVGMQRHRDAPMSGPVDGSPGVSVYTIPFAPGVRKMAGVRRWMAGLRIASVLAKNGARNPVLWFYHPSLFALGYSHSDAAIVYDVMDHFPSFENAVDDIYFDELGILAEADVVFTGGRSLDRHAREMIRVLTESNSPPQSRASHRITHCYPSGVDLDHFSKAMNQAPELDDEIDQLMANRPRPYFGYFGAIDERIDWSIIRALADATPGTVMLAGPILQPPTIDLPENVYLPGAVAYEKLPGLLSRFDVCLIPFRDTPLVQFVSPTKTPEYLAGGKPVVSAPIPDVMADYGDVVKIGMSEKEFVNHCLSLASERTDSAALVIEAKRRARTWDQIAAGMLTDIHGAIQNANRKARS